MSLMRRLQKTRSISDIDDIMRNMKIFRNIGLAALAASFLSACVRENIDPDGTGMKISLGAKVNAVVLSTKAAIDHNYQSENGLPINLIRWDENEREETAGRDELSATLDGTYGTSYQREIDITPVQFYKDREREVGFAGWYPAKDAEEHGGGGWTLEQNNVIHDNNTMHYALLKDGVLNVETDVMIGDFVKGNYATGIPAMEFQHALCRYNIYVYAVDGETADYWGALKKLSLSNLPTELIVTLPERLGESAVSFDYDGKTEYDVFDSSDSQDGPMELPAGMNSARRVMTLLGGDPKEGVLGITASTEKFEGGNSVSIARNFRAGNVYNIYLRFSLKGIINAELSVSDWTYNENDYIINQDFDLLTDLSRYGTSNSYIVSSANRGYCFTGTVKGNGPEGSRLTGNNSSIVLEPNVYIDTAAVKSVKIVRSDALMKKNDDGSWTKVTDLNERADTGKLINMLSNQLSKGRVVFRVPGAEDENDFSLQYKGNVKIAAFDATGNIIWSWHIWVTDKPIHQGYSNGYVALDRNLGAVMSDSEGFSEGDIAYTGLYYQWGRKDPMFPAPFNSGGQQWPVWGVEQSEHPASSGSAASVEETVRHPMTYYFDGSGGNGWLSASDSRYLNYDHFWGYISVRDDIKKTIYDPCPPGYRVPGNALWEDPDPGMKGEPVTSDGTANGHFAGYQFTINDMIEIYYPSTSCITVEKGQVVEKYHDNIDIEGNPVSSSSVVDDFVFMYSATPYEPGESDSDNFHDLAYHFRYNQDELGESYTRVMTADPDNYHVKRADAYPVRCVFENSAPVVTDLSEAQTANSYIISSSGFYEFDASVRGNGVSELTGYIDGNVTSVTISAGMSDVISDAHHVDVLWWQGDLSEGSHYREIVERTENMSDDQISELIDAECPVIVYDDGLLVDGKPLIRVVTNDNTYGNVGLAVYDRSGKILWSWHIWIQKDVGTVSFGELTLMDRNLGATYHDYPNLGQNNTAASYGFYYQWGRKDPFFKPDQVWFEKTDDGWKRRIGNITDTKGEILESVQNPLTFFKGNGINDNAWQTTYSSGGNNPALPRLWGYVGGVNATGASYAKTMYDPCPPGYRILQHNAFGLANICDADQENEYTFLWNNTNAIYFDNSTYLQNKGNADAGGIWFPNAGYIDWNGTSGTDNVSKLSLSTANAAGAYCREIRWRRNNNQYYAISQKSNAAWDVRPYMCLGRVVRCQME